MKKLIVFVVSLVMAVSLSSCSVPIISDFFESEESLGKTNNTAATIGEALKDYLKLQEKENYALYGVDMRLNSDANGMLKFYYCGVAPMDAEYGDVWVAEVNSKTAHVERFSALDYEEDGEAPYFMVKNNESFDAGSLPFDSFRAIGAGVRAFSDDLEFQYDYVQISLTAPKGKACYDIRYLSMLNDTIYCCTIDAVSGAVLASSTEVLEQEDKL